MKEQFAVVQCSVVQQERRVHTEARREGIEGKGEGRKV
jgi:hypothetical protein